MGAMPARLAISSEEGPCLELELTGKPVTIGRAADNAVRSLDRRTSRHHVIVRKSAGGGWEVLDPGSSYGLLLNGRKVAPEQPERLAHMDMLSAGGVQVQYLVIDDVEEIDGDGPTGAFSASELGEAERSQLRGEVQTLIDEQVRLRRELGKAQDDVVRTELERDASRKERDATIEETARLKAALEEQRGEIGRLGARIESLGNELRTARSAGGGGGGDEAARLQRQLAEASRAAERHDVRVKELEEREAQLVLKQQEQKKEIDRLQELNLKREKREAELAQAVKPALMRVAQLQQELEAMRVQLAQAQADLAAERKRG